MERIVKTETQPSQGTTTQRNWQEICLHIKGVAPLSVTKWNMERFDIEWVPKREQQQQ